MVRSIAVQFRYEPSILFHLSIVSFAAARRGAAGCGACAWRSPALMAVWHASRTSDDGSVAVSTRGSEPGPTRTDKVRKRAHFKVALAQ